LLLRRVVAAVERSLVIQFRLLYNAFTGAPTRLYTRDMSESVKHIAWDSITPEQLNPLLTRQFVTGEQAMVSRIQLKKGCVVPRHAHANEQIAFILSGALRFSVGEEGSARDYIVRGGEVLVIPGNVPHLAEALEDTDNVDIFAPPRQDWITGDDSYLRGR
jgi:quercetin dioxygenase-like cupin family protein